ncbi:hypothetical protein GCM10023194_71630 [Planotetraspora phitsanulokensis]|uniref:Uncharacterized protein n=1 Tax=Planotetraspora phitsanulokensis TaxID=575192 RepID=A0A8J3XI87_9ACTN|nr:hypothetical protein [Planotetraspora phitsanulokensis]GII37338.1 hypothetical protein Pph01_23410 [Planotetraspora phitsanulokensis]
MASGPHERRPQQDADDDGRAHDEGHTEPPPTLHHTPPIVSPWAMPPFGAPVPEDAEEPEGAAPPESAQNLWAPQPEPSPGDGAQAAESKREPRTGRRPYSSSSGPAQPRHSRTGDRRSGENPPPQPGSPGSAPAAGPSPDPSARPAAPAAGPLPDPFVRPAASADPSGSTGPASDPSGVPGSSGVSGSIGSTGSEGSGGPSGPASGSGAPAEPPRRRLVDAPDKLVASGPPRTPRANIPTEDPDAAAPRRGRRLPYSSADDRTLAHRPPAPGTGDPGSPSSSGIRLGPEIPAEPEAVASPGDPPVHQPGLEPAYQPFLEPVHPPDPGPSQEPVERIGRPPGGRPARPDVLVAIGPPRTGDGRRHRRLRPRRFGPGRLVFPIVVTIVLLVAAGLGVAAVNWARAPQAAGLRLAAGDGQSGDAAFAAPGLPGNGSSQVLNAIASVGSTVVAVGSDTTGTLPRPLFLVSTDGGRDWDLGRVAGPAGYEAGAGAVGRVVGGGGRWLAVGNDVSGWAGQAARGMWVSVDGRAWTAVDPEGLAAFGSQDRIADVARTASGFVAVGAAALKNGTIGPVAWTSPDGRTWTRAGEIGTPDKVRGMRAVVARGDQVVALADPGPGDSGSVILRSADGGRTWSRTASTLASVQPEPGALTAAGNGYVLVPLRQRSAAGEVTVYCSPEGARWSECGTIGGLGSEGTGVRGLASSSAGVAAVVESAWETYAVYTSADGRKWAKKANLGEIPGTLRGLTITDAGLVVAGGDKRGAGDVENLPVLMTAGDGKDPRSVPLGSVAGLSHLARDTADVAVSGGAFVAVGSANGDAAIWTSGNNGANWTDARLSALLGGPGRQALNSVAHGSKGWLAAGSTMTDPAVTRPLLVTSSDGRSWKAGPALEVPAGHFLVAPRLVAAGPKGYVLAGDDRSATGVVPALWFSPDLKRFTRVPASGMPAGGAGVRLAAVTATPSGFMAVGGSGGADLETGVAWVSSDGLRWAPASRVVPDDARSAGLRQVVATGSGVVAVGTAVTDEGVRPFSVVSADNGAHWEYGSLPADETAVVLDLVAAGGGLVAVGSHGPAGEGDSAAWISEDGLAWTRQALTQDGLGGAGTQWLGTVAVSGSRVLAIGRSTGYADDHLTIWRSSLTAGSR